MSSPTPDLDVQLDLLADAERRQALVILARSEPPLTLRDLATELVTRQHGSVLTEVPSEAVTETFARLHHVHVPKLANAGVVEYDANRRRIDGLALDALGPTLDAVTDAAVE